MKKATFLLVLMATGLAAAAQHIQYDADSVSIRKVGQLYFHITSRNTAELTYMLCPNGVCDWYPDTVVVPPSVTIDGHEYTVNRIGDGAVNGGFGGGDAGHLRRQLGGAVGRPLPRRLLAGGHPGAVGGAVCDEHADVVAHPAHPPALRGGMYPLAASVCRALLPDFSFAVICLFFVSIQDNKKNCKIVSRLTIKYRIGTVFLNVRYRTRRTDRSRKQRSPFPVRSRGSAVRQNIAIP